MTSNCFSNILQCTSQAQFLLLPGVSCDTAHEHGFSLQRRRSYGTGRIVCVRVSVCVCEVESSTYGTIINLDYLAVSALPPASH